MRKHFAFVSAVAVFLGLLYAEPKELPASISDTEFWRMVSEFSEPGGAFQEQFMSNEDSAQFVIPDLKQSTKAGGVYIGVGPEQNFTYIAAIRPKLASPISSRPRPAARPMPRRPPSCSPSTTISSPPTAATRKRLGN